MLDTATFTSTTQDQQDVALTETARLAVSVNSKHREVQRLGRTAKEIAAEIGEELIKVKEEKLDDGQFIPWIEANCSFSRKRAHEYMKVAEAKCHSRVTFDRSSSIREVLALGKAKPTLKQELRAATLNDLRKVERLRALRDNPAASEGEKANAQAKLNEIEKEIGKVEPKMEKAKQTTGQPPRHAVRLRACAVLDKVAPTLVGNPRSMIISALMIAYGDTPEKIEELLEALKGTR